MFHVKQLDDLQRLLQFLKTDNIDLSDQQIFNLKVYLSELIRFATKHRIVSTKDIEHIVSRHFLSSFCFVKRIKEIISAEDSILDLGSGAGFPGIVLSIMLHNKVVMVDSIRKKTLFLNRVVKKLGLNSEIINDRIELYAQKEKREFKIITARALASINDLIDLSHPFLLKGELHTIKGLDFKNEITGRETEIDLSFSSIDAKWVKYSEYLDSKVYVTFSLVNE